MKTHLFVWDDRFWYATPSLPPATTRRYSIAVLLSISGNAFRLTIRGKPALTAQAAVIGPDVERAVDAIASGLLSLNFDPQTYEYLTLQKYLNARRVAVLDIDDFRSLRPALEAFANGALTCGQAFRLSHEIARTISDYKPPNVMLDLRVLHVAQRLKQELPKAPTIEDLAENVGLSPDRLTHLFTEQLGLSVRNYLLWAKIRRATVLLGSGTRLTEIAQRAGFADSAHFSRTFKEFFGLSPSFVADSQRVAVTGCIGP